MLWLLLALAVVALAVYAAVALVKSSPDTAKQAIAIVCCLVAALVILLAIGQISGFIQR